MPYAKWDPAAKTPGVTLSGGDLTHISTDTSIYAALRATSSVSSGKWYWEITLNSGSSSIESFGVVNSSFPVNGTVYAGQTVNCTAQYRNGNIVKNDAIVGSAAGWGNNGDVICVALDFDAGTLSFKRNAGAWYSTSSLPAGSLFPYYGAAGGGTSGSFTTNFGETEFAYTPPTGHIGISGAEALEQSMSGGGSVGSETTTSFNPHLQEMLGGTTVASEFQLVFASAVEYSMLAGIQSAGSSAVLFGGVDSYDMLGGLTVADIATVAFESPITYEEETSGGFSVGADVVYEFEGTVDVAFFVGASSTVELFTPASYIVAPDGGVEWGGAATVQESLVHIPTGGFVFGSGAQIQEVLPFKPSGGAVWGGTATATITYAPSVSGGYVYSGAAPISVVYTIEAPTGGIVFGGDAAESDRSAWHAPSGGLEWSGAATAYAQTAVYTASTENPTNDPYYAWSINAENQAVSRYVRFFANSMAQLGGKTYVSNAGGIYEVGADDDAGQPIRASVLFPKTDFSESRTKRMEVAYLGAVTQGKLRLKMMANEDEPRYYAALPRGDSAKGAIVRIGKGMAGRYWTMRLDNVDGCDFELDSAEFKPIPSRTRHGA